MYWQKCTGAAPVSKERSARRHWCEKFVTFPETLLVSLCCISVPLCKTGKAEVPLFSSVPSLPLAPPSLEAVQRLTEYRGLFTRVFLWKALGWVAWDSPKFSSFSYIFQDERVPPPGETHTQLTLTQPNKTDSAISKDDFPWLRRSSCASGLGPAYSSGCSSLLSVSHTEPLEMKHIHVVSTWEKVL